LASPGGAPTRFFEAEAFEFGAIGAPLDAASGGVPEAGGFPFSFAGGSFGFFASASVAGGEVIAAKVLTSIFKSTGVCFPAARSTSLVAGEKPS
jgi:hypothetical protein